MLSSYAFWNNKGGVGKSFLCFVAACEYAHRNEAIDVYVIDLCPQANVSETLLGGYRNSPDAMQEHISDQPRRTIAGYLEARLNSPFSMIQDVTPYISRPYEWNADVPENLYLVCGDNLLEVISEAIRQTSQLVIPTNAWKQVMSWVRDLSSALRARSAERDAVVIVDCNPSFAIYTQLALSAVENVIVPFTADDSSRRAVENVVALMYGLGDEHTKVYAKLSFYDKAVAQGLSVPKLHTFVSNRVTLYDGEPSKAFKAVSKTIKSTVDALHKNHRAIFSDPKKKPSKSFVNVPDYHGACIVAGMLGTPIHKLKAGPKVVAGERIQLNVQPLTRYREALSKFVSRL